MPPPPPIGTSSAARKPDQAEPSRLDGLENLATYLHRFRPEITARVQEEAKPLHSPATDPPHPKLAQALRRPYPAQAHAITAALKTLQTEPAAFICGEMGVGKTLLGALIPWIHRQDSRTLIMCPGHLVEKWKREILITVPDAQAEIILNLADAIKCLDTPRSGKPQFWILSKETGKLGYFTRPGVKIKLVERKAYSEKKQETYTIIEEQCYCPSCGQRIERKPKTDGDLPRPILYHELKKNSHKLCKAELPKAAPTKDGKPRLCNTPLWTADNHRVRKIAIADFFKRRGARFDFFIADEVHELKGADTEQGNALGKLASCAEKILCLTGTLIGGYSTHLYHLLYRANPTEMKRAGFTYGKTDPWVDRYGIREITFKEITDSKGATRCARGAGTTTGSKTGDLEKPGISPALFAERLLNSALFLHLEDVAAGLPPITETPIGIDMDPELKAAYHRMESDIKSVMDQQLAQGNRQLLGRFLVNLLSYTDKPFENEPIDLGDGGFCIPEELDQETERNKERKLAEIVRANKARGRKCLIYLTFTGRRDTQPRIKKLLADYGIKAEILYSRSVKPSIREQWIFDHQADLDALIVNPECVKTGLDLIAFPTVIYLQTGYNVFTLRQSSRRSWRIGQTEPVEIYYLYYKATMQARAVQLVGKKLSASTALEGRLTAEGLQTLAGDDEDDAMALARALCQGNTIEGIESTWRTLNGTQQLEKLTYEVIDLATYRLEHQPRQAQEGLFDAPAPLPPEEADEPNPQTCEISQTHQAEKTSLVIEPMYPDAEPNPEPPLIPIIAYYLQTGPKDIIDLRSWLLSVGRHDGDDEIWSALLEMELAGTIRQAPGKIFTLKAAALKPPTQPDESAPIEPTPDTEPLPNATVEAQQHEADALAAKTLQPITTPDPPPTPQPIATATLTIGAGRQQATILQFKPRKKHREDPNQTSLF